MAKESSNSGVLYIDPGFIDALFDLAIAEAEYGDLEAAGNDFKRVLAARPGDAKAKQHLGELLYMQGDRLSQSGKFSDACSTYQEALQYRVGDPELHATLAVALARSGRLAEARVQLRQALKIDAAFAPAKQALAALEREPSAR